MFGEYSQHEKTSLDLQRHSSLKQISNIAESVAEYNRGKLVLSS